MEYETLIYSFLIPLSKLTGSLFLLIYSFGKEKTQHKSNVFLFLEIPDCLFGLDIPWVCIK